MSSWQPSNVYSDYAPIDANKALLDPPTAEMLQVDATDSPRGLSRGVANMQVKVLPVKAAAGASQHANSAPNPPPRTGVPQNSEQNQAFQQQPSQYVAAGQNSVAPGQNPMAAGQNSARGLRKTEEEFPLGTGEDLSPQQLTDQANTWAKRNGFAPEQLQEFGHLIAMVAVSYIPRSQITSLRQLDQGSFGLIYSANYDGAQVAVKQCSSDGSQIKAKMRELLLELSVLVRIRHPNVVTFWGTAADFPTHPTAKPYIGMVFELCSRGSLYKLLHQNGGQRFPFKEKMRIALEVARGMSYIHAKCIIHRDLNSRNILLNDQTQVKVADFGCARKVKGSALVTTTISGSPAYMAPEQLEGKDLTDKIDVWAFGVLLWEIVTEQVPWASKGNSLDGLKRAVCTNKERLPLPSADKFPNGWRAQYVKLMEMTWNSNPTARPSMAEMVKGLEALNNQEAVSVGEFM